MPGLCATCRGWCRGALCEGCAAAGTREVPRCERCAIALPRTAALATCAACEAQPPAFRRVVCAGDYGFPWDRLVAGLKYGHRVEWAGALAERVVAAAARPGPLPAAGAVVVPVPLAPRRLRERGFNQAWEIARRVARSLRLEAAPGWLLRPRDAAPQAGLARHERLANLRGAFAVTAAGHRGLVGRDVILVDDVLTTGATAQAAALALRAAGAGGVEVWVVARTPAP
jgi:ComF family protein